MLFVDSLCFVLVLSFMCCDTMTHLRFLHLLLYLNNIVILGHDPIQDLGLFLRLPRGGVACDGGMCNAIAIEVGQLVGRARFVFVQGGARSAESRDTDAALSSPTSRGAATTDVVALSADSITVVYAEHALEHEPGDDEPKEGVSRFVFSCSRTYAAAWNGLLFSQPRY